MRFLVDMARFLLFFAAIGAAVFIPRSDISGAFQLASRDDDPGQELDQVCSPSCQQSSCAGGFCSLSLERRSLHGFGEAMSWESDVNSTLFKRVFNYKPGNQAQYRKRPPTNDEAAIYLYAVREGHEDYYYGSPLPTTHATSSAARSQQVEFRNEPFQIMSSGLVGCTVVVIVSDKAVWMAHFWQTYSNGPFQSNGAHDSRDDPVFHQRVLDHISGHTVEEPAAPLPPAHRPSFWSDPENWPSYAYVEPIGPSVDKTLFAERKTRVFIMTPVYVNQPARQEHMLYPVRMKEVIKRINDVLGYKPRTIAVPYTPRQADYEAHRDYMGKALFQYDPNSNNRQKKAYRIFFENRFVDITAV